MKRCPLCGQTKRFKPGGFADICRGCNHAFGPFGGVELSDEKPPLRAWLVVIAFVVILYGSLLF